MTLRGFSLLMALGSLLAWAAWVMIIVNIDPSEAGFAGFLLFYATLAVALVGTVTLALSFIRLVILRRKAVPSREIGTSFRHAMLFAAVAITSLALSAHGYLQTWHLVLLVALVTLVEAGFIQLQRR
jgi:hypothetical protein